MLNLDADQKMEKQLLFVKKEDMSSKKKTYGYLSILSHASSSLSSNAIFNF